MGEVTTQGMTYKVNVGPKKISSFMGKLDLGVDGVCNEVLTCKLTTQSPFSEELIKKHKEGLREALGEFYYVGEIKFIR